LPGLARSQGQSRQAQCVGNLRQLTLAHLGYGLENRERLPFNGDGFWAWDLYPPITDALAPYGASRNQFYCPENPGQNIDGLWNFVSTITFLRYRVTGYAFTLPGTPSLYPTNVNAMITPQQVQVTSVLLSAPPAATRVLVSDATLSNGSVTSNKLTYQFSGIAGEAAVHRSAHMDFVGQYPRGENVGMQDGHSEWHTFAASICRTTGTNVPGFWW
jgi:hypothetical protein